MGATNAAKKAGGRVNAITGVKMGKVDAEHLRKVAGELGVECGEETEQAVVAVSSYFAARTPAADLLVCDECGGKSPSALDACPYCGGTDDTESASAEKPVAKPAEKKSEPEAPPAATPAVTTTAGKKDEAKMGQAAAKAETKAAAKAAKAETKAAKAAPAVAVVASIVRDDTRPSSAIVTERELDAKVEKIQQLKGQAAVSYWHLGVAIKELFDGNTWKLRNGEDGKPKWKSFDAFVHHEIQMTPQNAYSIMDVAKSYSEAQVRAFGHTKLGLLLQAPSEDRERILKEVVEKGGSKREVEKEVRKARKEKGHHTKVRRDGKPLPTAPKGAKKQTITVANMVGRKTIKLFKKPAGYKYGQPLDGARAKRLGDIPFGVNDLENDVKQFFTVQESPTGELTLVIETRRVD